MHISTIALTWIILSLAVGVFAAMIIETGKRRDLYIRIKTLLLIRKRMVDDRQGKSEINRHVRRLIRDEKIRRRQT